MRANVWVRLEQMPEIVALAALNRLMWIWSAVNRLEAACISCGCCRASQCMIVLSRTVLCAQFHNQLCNANSPSQSKLNCAGLRTEFSIDLGTQDVLTTGRRAGYLYALHFAWHQGGGSTWPRAIRTAFGEAMDQMAAQILQAGGFARPAPS